MLTIVYCTNAGHTKEFADLLAAKCGLMAIEISQAKKYVAKGSDILYFGWLMAGKVKGYRTAAKRYRIKAVIGVGMAPAGSQVEDIRLNNFIPKDVAVFSLQGGFEMDKLSGLYRLMMSVMNNTAGKAIRAKQNRTPEEQVLLEQMLDGKNMVSADQLEDLRYWIEIWRMSI